MGGRKSPFALNKGDNMKSNYGSSIFYRLKQISLEPDKYGKHLKIKMVSAYTGDGKFIKHIKLDEDMLNILSEGWIVYNEPAEKESL
tara:strand:+ start:506 stop:766 length:261 start_codon:yes stop_codon:yes gene_type:complete